MCGDVRFSWGPDGPPQRRCWACGHVWAPVDLERDVQDHPVVRAALEKLAGQVVRHRRHR